MKNEFLLVLHPGLMILSGLISLVFLMWLFWPKKGLVSMLSKLKRNNRRVQLEDALKYLFDCEYKNVTCHVNSIAGNLNITPDQAGKLSAL